MTGIYLDNNATTTLDPRVIETMHEYLQRGYVNPSSQHRPGQAARRELERLRHEIVEMLGGVTGGRSPDRLIFTSGGTESNNLALLGIGLDPRGQGTGRVVVSSIEHPSIGMTADVLAQRGCDVAQIPAGTSGQIEGPDVGDILNESTSLVSVMWANNETGVVQPIGSWCEAAHRHGALFHTDAVQAIGKTEVHFRESGADMLTLAAHKFHGPRGIGALLVKHDVVLRPILFGGFQQSGMRPGTEDVVLVAGLHRALQVYLDEGRAAREQMAALRDRLESGLLQRIPSAIVIGSLSERLPHTSCISFPGLDRQAILLAADMAGLAIATGSACASGSSEPSPVLTAMGLDPLAIEGAIRISLSRRTTVDEIDQAISIIAEIVGKIGGQKG